MLTLHSDSSLSREEIWLKKSYTNIVYRLVESTITTSSEFDPFAAKFMGINSIEYDKFQYQAVLETTSYFWASKGGRGTLLEKIIASLGNSHSYNGVTLPRVLAIISSAQNTSPPLIKSNIKRLKFDLVNIVSDRLIILELKNRVDSGGTAAREESLGKKFLTICRTIENEDKIFEYHGKYYDFGELLTTLGINKIEMCMGLLFNIHGKEATIDADRLDGFYSSSKTHMKNYANESHLDTNIEFDQSRLRLYLKKRSLLISVEMLYGNEVIQRFSSKKYCLDNLMEKVFSKSWDDIWITFNVAISERAILLRTRKNHIILIKNLKENDEYFNSLFNKFCTHSLDSEILSELVHYVVSKLDLTNPSAAANEDISYLADCLYAFASYIISRGTLIKSKKKMADISTDINKGVLAKG
jgi:hypothetical protein